MIKRLHIIFIAAVIAIALLGLPSCSAKNSDAKNHKEHAHTEDAIYTCSMHPEIREKTPGNCPICGMKLVKVPEANSKSGKENTSGFQISPYQASLVGIKPIQATTKAVTYSLPVSGRMVSKTTLALQVFERDLRYIKPGVSFFGHSEVFPEDLIRGEISSVDNMADPGSRTIRVMGRIKEGGRNSLSEASFSGNVVIDLGKKLVVPEKSVLFTGNGNFVYLYKDDTLHPQKVSLGPKVNEEYVILSGLSDGDLISSGPNFLIDSESKLRGVSTPDTTPVCPDGQKWNAPMAMCMPDKDL
jgi:hypothetical protein